METLKRPRSQRDSEKPAGPVPVRRRPRGFEPGSLLAVDEFTRERFTRECAGFLYPLKGCASVAGARETLRDRIIRLRVEGSLDENRPWHRTVARTRDCTRAFLSMLSERSERLAGFSLVEALWDVARELPRPDLGPGFFAEMLHLVWGLEGRTVDRPLYEQESAAGDLEGREAAVVRSRELDKLWDRVESWMRRNTHGLQPESLERRELRKKEILASLGGTEEDWNDWRWHVANVGKDVEGLEQLVELTDNERENIGRTCAHRLPFGVTPFYASLMDEAGSMRDRAVRAQVFPPTTYVDKMVADRDNREEAFDFMGEQDTSPIDLVTRRYPGIAILKPFNTCPQICVYCQRNWEIDEVLAPNAMAPWEKIEDAVRWLGDHPAIHEVLITGGDPFLLETEDLERLLTMVAAPPLRAPNPDRHPHAGHHAHAHRRRAGGVARPLPRADPGGGGGDPRGAPLRGQPGDGGRGGQAAHPRDLHVQPARLHLLRVAPVRGCPPAPAPSPGGDRPVLHLPSQG